jgi:glucuronokinase
VKPATGTAFARIGLLGNPSDAYGGSAVAATFPHFSASVTLQPAEQFSIRVPDEGFEFESLAEFEDQVERRGCDDAVRLLRAAIHRFVAHTGVLAEATGRDRRQCFEVSYTTDIPRQVGLSGSSAIVIATLRALMRWFEVTIEPAELAEVALAAEVEDLRIAAGPMDRVIQCYEGLMAMDFSGPRGPSAYRRLDPTLLPPLLVAWDPERGTSSGVTHSDLRARFERRDADVLEAIDQLRAGVDAGIDALTRGDVAAFQRAVDRNFDLRASICEISDRDRQMVELGRENGAAVKFCGSGGSVVAVVRDSADVGGLMAGYRSAGFDAAVYYASPPGSRATRRRREQIGGH